MLEYGTSPYGDQAPPPPPPLLYELRPLSLGEILDRTFALYKRRFWLYAGLSTVAAAFSSIYTLVRLSMGNVFGNLAALGVPGAPAAKTPVPTNPKQVLLYAGVIFITMLFYLIAYALTQAATVAALSAVYIGEETSITIALRRVRSHWFRYILILLWQGWSGMWIFAVLLIPGAACLAVPSLRVLGGFLIFFAFASLIYAPFAIIRNSLGIVASAVEDLKVRASMRRSKFLVAGHKGRVLAIFLLVWVMSVAAAVVQLIFLVPAEFTHGVLKIGFDGLALLATFVTTAAVTPIASIAMCLFYIDERVRKEGFDIEVLMLRGSTPPPPDAFPSPFTSELA